MFLPMIVSDYVTIGKDTVVKAAKIGSCVEIGSNCVIVSAHRPPVKRATRRGACTRRQPVSVVPFATCPQGERVLISSCCRIMKDTVCLSVSTVASMSGFPLQ